MRAPLRRPVRLAVAAAVIATLSVPVLATTRPAGAGAAGCPWMDRSKSADQRATELVKAMTLDQKIAELYGRGDFTYYGAANDIPAVPALCIPELVFNDAGAGVGDEQTNTTAFPDGIAQAASWDTGMQRRLGAALGWEAWHKGVDVQLAPGVDIARNPLNGRTFEYAGEDPFLAGRTAVAEINGIQSQHVVATVKHYALNDQEANRMTDSSDASERTMQEIHLPAYEAAVRRGHVGSVMCSYNRINGVYACEDRALLRTILEKQFGFRGWVMSDWGGTHSTVRAANAGLDQEQTIGKGTYFSDALKTAVQSGKVPMSRLNDMVTRLMRSLFRVGVFDDPPAPEPQASTAVVDTAAEQAIARAAADGGAVLLKNGHATLPIHGNGKTIAVIGRAAGPAGAQNAYQGGGSSRVPFSGGNPRVVDPLQGITARAAIDGDTVTYADGTDIADAVATATTADIAVVVVSDLASEGSDRPDLSLQTGTCTIFSCVRDPGPTEDQLIAEVAAANPHTVVVLQTGAPVTMPWLSKVRSVLEMWYAGEQEGNAAADLLFGDVNPSGKLPLTFPKKLSDGPLRSPKQYPGVDDQSGVPHSHYTEGLLVGYRWYDAKGIKPLFAFGHGLTYTTFRFSALHLSRTSGGVRVRFRVTNTGTRAGAQVAQVYVSDPSRSGEPPRQLKGVTRVSLAPGAGRTVSLVLHRRAFARWSTARGGWTVDRGCYVVRVGSASDRLPLHAKVGRGGARCS